MRRVDTCEHVPFSEEFVVVLLGLRIEAGIMIRVPGKCRGTGSGGRTHDRFVEPANPPRSGIKRPDVIAAIFAIITPADKSGSANLLGREDRVKREQPQPFGKFEVGIDRNGIDFGSSYQVIAGVVSDLEILDLPGLRSTMLVLGIAIIKPQIVVIRSDGPKDVIPDDLFGDERIVRVD